MKYLNNFLSGALIAGMLFGCQNQEQVEEQVTASMVNELVQISGVNLIEVSETRAEELLDAAITPEEHSLKEGLVQLTKAVESAYRNGAASPFHEQLASSPYTEVRMYDMYMKNGCTSLAVEKQLNSQGLTLDKITQKLKQGDSQYYPNVTVFNRETADFSLPPFIMASVKFDL